MFEESDVETAVPGLVSRASGVVLELGPGTGGQVSRFDRSKIAKVYGIEPNVGLHAQLRQRIEDLGLTDTYELVSASIDDMTELRSSGIVEGAVDTILSVQVLCSVTDTNATLRRLYSLLKPGGQLIVYEHVRSKDIVTRFVQGQCLIVSVITLACVDG